MDLGILSVAGRGRPRESGSVHTISGRVAAMKHANKAMRVLVDMLTSPQHAVRVSAANSILDRAYGKPSQAVEVTGKDGGPVEHEHRVQSDAERFTSAIASLVARDAEGAASGETQH